MRIAVVGAGTVGLATSVVFAHLGHDVRVLERDPKRLALLRGGQSGLHEHGLDASLGQLRFDQVLGDEELVFVAVGTPLSAEDTHDLSDVRAAAAAVRRRSDAPIVVRSTVPPGTQRDLTRAFGGAIASCPEFLRQGSAVLDTLCPDRLVIGTTSSALRDRLVELHRPILDQRFPALAGIAPRRSPVELVDTDPTTAELIKLASNAFLATKVSFANEIAALASQVSADVEGVLRGVGLDPRIGPGHLRPGLGWGGSCLSKDTAALLSAGTEHGVSLPLVRAAREVNEARRARVIERLEAALGGLAGKTIGLLGVAFKPGTHEVRDAPALDVARRLDERGARICAHDPVARTGACPMVATVSELAEQADALVLCTEWPEYAALDWRGLPMRGDVVIDARGVLRREAIEDAGLRYFAL